jgi:hypothetical protein
LEGEALADASGDVTGEGGQQREAAPKRAAGYCKREITRLDHRVALLRSVS